MEVYVFMVFMGLWMALLLIGVGYVLAKTDDHYRKKRNKDNSEHVHDGHSDSCVCSGRDSDLLARPVGDIHGEEHSRCNCRMVREMTNDALAAVLRRKPDTVRRGISRRSCKKDREGGRV